MSSQAISPCYATSDVNEAADLLTGGNAREWVFVEWRLLMGASNNCIEGESYRFVNDSTVLIRECIQGKVTDTSKTWKLKQADQLDTIVEIGEEDFILMFKKVDKCHLMRLRKLAATKTTPTIDKEFKLCEK